ncbi:MAG: hypothetical protein ABJK28_09270 [Algibacter sp.]
MSTPHNTDSRLSPLFDNTENLINILTTILSENYNKGMLSIGNNATKKFKKREAYYTIVDSDFENVFLTFIYKNTDISPWGIRLETFNTDYPTELKITVDSDVTDKLPQQMLSDLFDRLHDFDNDYY